MPLRRKIVGNRGDVRQEQLTFVTLNIPAVQEKFNKPENLFGIFGGDVQDQIDILLHVGADVADFAKRIYCSPLCGGDLALQSVYLLEKTGAFDPPEIPDHALQTTPRQCRRSLGTETQNAEGLFVVRPDGLRNVFRVFDGKGLGEKRRANAGGVRACPGGFGRDLIARRTKQKLDGESAFGCGWTGRGAMKRQVEGVNHTGIRGNTGMAKRADDTVRH